MRQQTSAALKRDIAWPELIAFDVTTKCNLRCVHCYNASGAGESRDMGVSALLDKAREIAQLHPFNVCLCGGEPLCCAALYDVIDILRPDVGRVCMVSNGWAITEEAALRLVEHGVDVIQISLDGACAWQHDTLRGVAGSFDRAVNAITYLKRAGIEQLNVSILPNKLNLNDLEAYVLLCMRLKVNLIRSMPFIPSGRGRTVGRGLMLTDEEIFAFLRRMRQLCNVYGRHVRFEWTDPLSHLLSMPERAREGIRNVDMEIRADGELGVSTYLPITVGSRSSHTLIEFWKSGYDRIWSDERILRLIKQVRCIYDLERFEPMPYAGETIQIDLGGSPIAI